MSLSDDFADAGGFVDYTLEEAVNALFDAINMDDRQVVGALIEAGVPVDARNEFGDTPLILAVHRGRYEMAQFLLDMKADPNAKNAEGFTPLFYGVRQNLGMLDLLFAHGAAYPEGKAPAIAARLTEATFAGYDRVVEAALAAGADPNTVAPNCDDACLLHLAAQNGNPRMVKALIAAGAEVNMLDKNQRSVLRAALRGGNLECVTAILEAGADTRNRSLDQKSGRTISDESASVDCDFDIARAVTQAAMKFNLLDAAASGAAKEVQMLLEAGVSPDAKLDEDGNTALYRACAKGHADVAKALLEHGANVHFRPKDKPSALFMAALSGSAECVRVLGEAGANVLAQEPGGASVVNMVEQAPAAGVSAEMSIVVRILKAAEVEKMAQNAIRLDGTVPPMTKLRFRLRQPSGV